MSGIRFVLPMAFVACNLGCDYGPLGSKDTEKNSSMREVRSSSTEPKSKERHATAAPSGARGDSLQNDPLGQSGSSLHPIAEGDPAYQGRKDLIAELHRYGVEILVDQGGRVKTALVPDTTDIRPVVEKLSSLPGLECVRFTLGPDLDAVDWNSPEFCARYADAMRKPIMRTWDFSRIESERILKEVRSKLPEIKIEVSPGAL